MFAVYGTNIVDNVTASGSMIKNGAVVTDKDLTALMGNYMDSSVTRTNTRLRLLRNATGQYNLNQLRQQAYFGEAALSFKNYAFLSYTHRFEEASTLPKKNRNYNYPGGSLSVILSDIFPELKRNSLISYWKIRTSLAGTARLNTPYSTNPYSLTTLRVEAVSPMASLIITKIFAPKDKALTNLVLSSDSLKAVSILISPIIIRLIKDRSFRTFASATAPDLC